MASDFTSKPMQLFYVTIRSVDLEARGAKCIESVPDVIIDYVLDRVQALLE